MPPKLEYKSEAEIYSQFFKFRNNTHVDVVECSSAKCFTLLQAHYPDVAQGSGCLEELHDLNERLFKEDIRQAILRHQPTDSDVTLHANIQNCQALFDERKKLIHFAETKMAEEPDEHDFVTIYKQNEQSEYVDEKLFLPFELCLHLLIRAIQDTERLAEVRPEATLEEKRQAAASEWDLRARNLFHSLEFIKQDGQCHTGDRNQLLVMVLEKVYPGINILRNAYFAIFDFIKPQFYQAIEQHFHANGTNPEFNRGLWDWIAEQDGHLLLQFIDPHSKTDQDIFNYFASYGCNPHRMKWLEQIEYCLSDIEFAAPPQGFPILQALQTIFAQGVKKLNVDEFNELHKQLLESDIRQLKFKPIQDIAYVATSYLEWVSNHNLLSLTQQMTPEIEQIPARIRVYLKLVKQYGLTTELHSTQRQHLSDFYEQLKSVKDRGMVSVIEGFFDRLFTSKACNSYDELEKCYDLLRDGEFMKMVAMDDDRIIEFMTNPCNKQDGKMILTLYLINRIFLYALMRDVNDWSSLFKRICLSVVNLVKSNFESDIIFAQYHHLLKTSFPVELVNQLHDLCSGQTSSQDKAIILPHHIKNFDDWQALVSIFGHYSRAHRYFHDVSLRILGGALKILHERGLLKLAYTLSVDYYQDVCDRYEKMFPGHIEARLLNLNNDRLLFDLTKHGLVFRYVRNPRSIATIVLRLKNQLAAKQFEECSPEENDYTDFVQGLVASAEESLSSQNARRLADQFFNDWLNNSESKSENKPTAAMMINEISDILPHLLFPVRVEAIMADRKDLMLATLLDKEFFAEFADIDLSTDEVSEANISVTMMHRFLLTAYFSEINDWSKEFAQVLNEVIYKSVTIYSIWEPVGKLIQVVNQKRCEYHQFAFYGTDVRPKMNIPRINIDAIDSLTDWLAFMWLYAGCKRTIKLIYLRNAEKLRPLLAEALSTQYISFASMVYDDLSFDVLNIIEYADLHALRLIIDCCADTTIQLRAAELYLTLLRKSENDWNDLTQILSGNLCLQSFSVEEMIQSQIITDFLVHTKQLIECMMLEPLAPENIVSIFSISICNQYVITTLHEYLSDEQKEFWVNIILDKLVEQSPQPASLMIHNFVTSLMLFHLNVRSAKAFLKYSDNTINEPIDTNLALMAVFYLYLHENAPNACRKLTKKTYFFDGKVLHSPRFKERLLNFDSSLFIDELAIVKMLGIVSRNVPRANSSKYEYLLHLGLKLLTRRLTVAHEGMVGQFIHYLLGGLINREQIYMPSDLFCNAVNFIHFEAKSAVWIGGVNHYNFNIQIKPHVHLLPIDSNHYATFQFGSAHYKLTLMSIAPHQIKLTCQLESKEYYTEKVVTLLCKRWLFRQPNSSMVTNADSNMNTVVNGR